MSQTPFNFIAHFRAKPGSEQVLEDALMACVAPTRALRRQCQLRPASQSERGRRFRDL